MLASLNWLKEYVEITDTPDVLADKLTRAGTPVEVITYMVPKNDYNKEERTKISDIVIGDFENYTTVKFTSKLKGIASYIFGTDSVVLNEDFEDAINKVRPSTFKKESVISFVMELVNSKYYVVIDKKHRRISK